MKLNKELSTISTILIVSVSFIPSVIPCYPHVNMHFSLDDDVVQQYLKLECSEDQVRDSFTQLCVSRCKDDELYFAKTKQCHKFNEYELEQGPCGDRMYLIRNYENPTHGRCDCRNNETRALVYSKRTNKCYFVYSQASCRRGKWLTLTNEIPHCVNNPCAQVQSQNPEVEFVWFNGSCVKLGDHCDHEGLDGKVSFGVNSTLQCHVQRSLPAVFAFGAISKSCPEGTYLSYGGNCQPAIEVDF